VTEDHADFRWNTMISALMELTNEMFRVRGTAGARTAQWDETVRLLLLMLAPIAPHISEELWSRRAAARGEEWTSVHAQRWPEFESALVALDQIDLPVQVNGRLRDVVSVRSGTAEAEIEQIVMARDKIRAQLDGHEIVRVVHVPGRLVNVVVRPRSG
jgi:leucyl-tRNA synthetase